MEEHEPVVDAVIREMKEETGLTVERPKLCGVKEWINGDGSRYVVVLFTADRFTGELASSREGRVFWVEQDEVLKTRWMKEPTARSSIRLSRCLFPCLSELMILPALLRVQ